MPIKSQNTVRAHRVENDSHESWFSDFIQKLNEAVVADKSMLESGTAPKQTRDFYKSLIEGDNLATLSLVRKSTSQNLSREIIVSYLKQISHLIPFIQKIGLDMSDNKVHVWLEIGDADESTESQLIRAESFINGTLGYTIGILIDSTIVEASDQLIMPEHFQILEFNSSK